MQIRILLVAASVQEIDILKTIPGIESYKEGLRFQNSLIIPLVTGVGSMATSWTLSKWFSTNQRPDLAINIGIAGSYSDSLKIGDVVMPVTDCFADSGIETNEGFQTLSEAGLLDPDVFPFTSGKIIAENKFITLASSLIRKADAITVNCASGTETTISRLEKKYKPDIETMEGATFFYICKGENIPFLALRSISNRVEPRNKNNWNIPLALDKLSEKLKELLLLFD